MSSHDTGTSEPIFDELKDFITTKAEAAQKKTVYDKKYAIRNGNLEPATPLRSPMPAAMPVQAIAITPAPALDPIAELTKQMTRLALAMQASMQEQPPVSTANVNAPTSVPAPYTDRPQWV